jgi:hypothetical protein
MVRGHVHWESIRWKPVSSVNMKTRIWPVGSETYVPRRTLEFYEKMPALLFLCLLGTPSSILSLSTLPPNLPGAGFLDRTSKQEMGQRQGGWRRAPYPGFPVAMERFRCGISGSNQQARLWCPDIEERPSAPIEAAGKFFMSVKLFRFFLPNTSLDPAPISG